MANFLFYPVNLALAEEGSGGDTSAIEAEIQAKQDKIKALQEKINEYNDSINFYNKQSVSLSSQVNILTKEINKLEAEIELKENEIDSANLEIQDTQEKITNTEADIATSKEHLKKFLQKINLMDQKSTLEILLTKESFSDYYDYIHALEILQTKTSNSLGELKTFKENLNVHIASIEDKKIELEKFKKELESKKGALDSRNYAKIALLNESKNSESKFKSLVAELKAEQSDINADIVALERSVRGGLDNTQLKSISASGFMWPVPSRSITAYFHDPDYPFRYIFEHPAIDIGRTPQGTQIKAPTDGYVAKVVLNGTTYGYIMLIHSDGFSTVYGHISKSYVSADDYVAQGEVIGLTGGAPGTTGSGRLSTGPHLHFEIRKNGIPVNPLDYLP